uniref:NADH-ubiquinone oxidoreductase chain 4L n=1 Tax=Crenomytilus grayanus TaxID=151218 RepID=A0A516EZE4_CREGR|nr:NADH dehydrogenase subunit 4L [Crenomytilus grayanus]QDO71877.1 NADH dehydrogenase subunit 4L [Crenomytilus grayanus]
MVWMKFLGLFLMGMGCFVVFRMNTHLLSLFVGLEMMSLGLLFVGHVFLMNQFWVILLILCLAVCEASICLALLVMVMRLCGNDLMSSLVSDGL